MSRASEMKTRAKEALSINLHSEKYIRIIQMLETQLKRNRNRKSFILLLSLVLLLWDTTMWPWQLSPSCPPYLPDMTMWSCSTSILHFCPSFPEPWTSFLLLWIRSRNTWQCILASVIWSLSSSASISWLSPAVMRSLVTDRLLICRFDVILV